MIPIGSVENGREDGRRWSPACSNEMGEERKIRTGEEGKMSKGGLGAWGWGSRGSFNLGVG